MRTERGQTLVLVALLLVAMLAMVALAIDGGNAYSERRQMQTAADAGALAAARARCLGDAAWVSAGETQCEANSSQAAIACAVDGPGTYGSVWATASETISTWFAGIVGVPSISVGARAEASCEPISGTGTLVPLTIPVGSYGPDLPYAIWNKDYGTSGSFGWLQFDPLDEGCPQTNGLPQVKACIENPSCAPVVRAGEAIQTTEPGVMNTLLSELWDHWQCEVVVVPLYSSRTGTGNNTRYTISQFGAFQVTGMCDGKNHSYSCGGAPPECSGGDKIISGTFVKYLDADSIGGGSDSGVYVVYLSD